MKEVRSVEWDILLFLLMIYIYIYIHVRVSPFSLYIYVCIYIYIPFVLWLLSCTSVFHPSGGMFGGTSLQPRSFSFQERGSFGGRLRGDGRLRGIKSGRLLRIPEACTHLHANFGEAWRSLATHIGLTKRNFVVR